MKLTRRRLMAGALATAATAQNIAGSHSQATIEKGGKSVRRDRFTLWPIGKVEKKDGRVLLRIKRRYAGGLLGLGAFSHVHVLWWFNKNDTAQQRQILQVHPRGDKTNPLTGVFGTRAPVRPNLIATTLCGIRSIHDGAIEIDGIDAFDGTPILDLKPYIPALDCVEDDVRLPDWL